MLPHFKVRGHNKVMKRERGRGKKEIFFGGQLNSSSADVFNAQVRPSHSFFRVVQNHFQAHARPSLVSSLQPKKRMPR